MNNIQNYGFTNYQTTFNGKGKAEKILANEMTEKQLKAKLKEIYDKLPKLTCTCSAGEDNKNVHEGIINIIG